MFPKAPPKKTVRIANFEGLIRVLRIIRIKSIILPMNLDVEQFDIMSTC